MLVPELGDTDADADADAEGGFEGGFDHVARVANEPMRRLATLLAPLGTQAARDLYDQLGKLRQTLAQTDGLASSN